MRMKSMPPKKLCSRKPNPNCEASACSVASPNSVASEHSSWMRAASAAGVLVGVNWSRALSELSSGRRGMVGLNSREAGMEEKGREVGISGKEEDEGRGTRMEGKAEEDGRMVVGVGLLAAVRCSPMRRGGGASRGVAPPTTPNGGDKNDWRGNEEITFSSSSFPAVDELIVTVTETRAGVVVRTKGIVGTRPSADAGADSIIMQSSLGLWSRNPRLTSILYSSVSCSSFNPCPSSILYPSSIPYSSPLPFRSSNPLPTSILHSFNLCSSSIPPPFSPLSVVRGYSPDDTGDTRTRGGGLRSLTGATVAGKGGKEEVWEVGRV